MYYSRECTPALRRPESFSSNSRKIGVLETCHPAHPELYYKAGQYWERRCPIQTCIMASYTKRSLIDWSFTQIGGGQGTKADEWLKVSSFPTTVHVELLKLKKIPDPVRALTWLWTECCLNTFVQFLKLQEWDVQCLSLSSIHPRGMQIV